MSSTADAIRDREDAKRPKPPKKTTKAAREQLYEVQKADGEQPAGQ